MAISIIPFCCYTFICNSEIKSCNQLCNNLIALTTGAETLLIGREVPRLVRIDLTVLSFEVVFKLLFLLSHFVGSNLIGVIEIAL